MQFTNSVLIDRPVSEVFAFVSDFENMPKWNYFVVDVTNQSATYGIGTRYRQRRKADGQVYAVTEFEVDRRVTVHTIPPALDLQMRFTFEPKEGATLLTDEWLLDTGLPRWLDGIGTARVSAAVRNNLGRLKELLENGEVRLQDGRIETITRRSQ